MTRRRDERGQIHPVVGVVVFLTAAGIALWGAGKAWRAAQNDVAEEYRPTFGSGATAGPPDRFVGPPIPANYERTCVEGIAVSGYQLVMTENGWRSTNDNEPDTVDRAAHAAWKAKVSAQAQRAAVEWRERCKPSVRPPTTDPPKKLYSARWFLKEEGFQNEGQNQSVDPCASRKLPEFIDVYASQEETLVKLSNPLQPSADGQPQRGVFDGFSFEVKYPDGDREWQGQFEPTGNGNEAILRGRYYSGYCTWSFRGEAAK